MGQLLSSSLSTSKLQDNGIPGVSFGVFVVWSSVRGLPLTATAVTDADDGNTFFVFGSDDFDEDDDDEDSDDLALDF